MNKIDRDWLEALPYAAVGATKGVWEQFKPGPAVTAWATLAAGVTGYDVWAIKTNHETMSHAFHRAYEHPLYHLLCVGALGALAVHLAKGTGTTAPYPIHDRSGS